MNLLNGKTGYKPPESFFIDTQKNAHNDLQKIARLFSAGIVYGMAPTRNPINGSVEIGVGFGWDLSGRMINLEEIITLDFSTISRPTPGKFRKVAVIGAYNQIEVGEIQDDIGNSYWKEKREGIILSFIEGAEASTAGSTPYANVADGSFIIVDLIFDNASSGCLSIDLSRRSKQIDENPSLGEHNDRIPTQRAVKSYTDTHINRRDNPHVVTKAQVGLSSVPNWSGDTNAALGTSDVKIPSQKAVKAYADAHGNRRDNPHLVTKAQVGLGSVPNWAGSTSTALGTSNTVIPSQNAVKRYVDNAIQAAKNALWPVGSTYIQFPGDSSPSTLGLPGTWSNVSSELAGDFIRFEGSSALAFNGGRQHHSIQGHRHKVKIAGTSYDTVTLDRAADSSGDYSKLVGTAAGNSSPSALNITDPISDGAHGIPNIGSETKPVNRTVRKWRRTV